ncbi:unnamed protein product [Dicrocoelium dendriticum]|nr:unnamed protein product [Dicrocoelium dendriticum]
MVITPSGQVECLASGDRLHAGKLLCELGATVPTSSVDPRWLNAVSTRLAKAMVQKGFVGHFGIDFVTFIHPESVSFIEGCSVGFR